MPFALRIKNHAPCLILGMVNRLRACYNLITVDMAL
nr:MAG TPA: hypothetical protein [Caudoviricetes sp.]